MSLAIAKDTRIAVIGGGKMGEAIMGGWIGAEDGLAAVLGPENFVVANPGEARRTYLTETYGVSCVRTAAEIDEADIVLISVKPQKMSEVLPVLAARPFAATAFYISVVAGWTCERIEDALGGQARLCRLMPNTPLLVGCGATAVSTGSAASDDEAALVRDLFSCLGKAWIVDERQIDAVCAISGSGPAYVAHLIEALAGMGPEIGLDRDLAEQLALQTVLGTAQLMVQRHQSAEKTRIDVSSPGGTTLAALDAMDDAGFTASLEEGVRAAIRRADELGKM
ncbi:MAG: pyrroline-5-carboxylate reductase [Eggerthellaceae bacterium]